MFNCSIAKWLALLGGAALIASTTLADDKALLNALIQKGVLTQQEADQISADMAKANAGKDVVTSPADKYLKSLTFSGRFQTQFADLGTSINGTTVNPPATQHFLLRRIYLGVKADFGDGFSGVINYDFANVSFDAAYIEWKQSDVFAIDAGFKKVPFDYEEVTSSASLKAIERSVVTRYFDEPNNGRRLGAASYRTGLFAGGTEDGFFYSVAVTNPERNEYSGDGTSGPTVNGSGGVGTTGSNTSNNFAYYGWAGYGNKFDGGSYKFGGEAGYLPDQGGPTTTVGIGNNLTIYGIFADVTYQAFNLQGEWLDAQDHHGVSATKNASPKGYWIQPSYMIIPNSLEGVVRYSYIDSDGRGVAISDGIRSAPSGGTMDKLGEWYIGGNWYIKGKDVELQFGYIHGESKDTVTGASAKATTDGVRSQVQVNF